MSSPPTAAGATTNVSAVERETIKKLSWRLMPLLILGYFCAYLDRSNVGIAATTMLADLKFSNAVFGFGSGLFFLGYFVAELPSNLMLNKVGARIWLARIMLTWGIVASLTGFVSSTTGFYINRILLGIAEAGFYPGVVLYLMWWFPAKYRSFMLGIFMASSVIAVGLGAPIGSLLLRLDGWMGLHGWQWLFILEGLFPILVAVLFWQLLTDRPSQAHWLTDEQRAWLETTLRDENARVENRLRPSLRTVFTDPKMWLLTLAYFGQNVSAYGLVFFVPLIVKGLGTPKDWIGLVSALPSIFAVFAMIYWSRRSDIRGTRTFHCASAALLSAAGLSACVFVGADQPVITMVILCIAFMGQLSIAPTFWPIPSSVLTGVAAAGGLAWINAVGNLGGWLGPSMFGAVKDATGSSNYGLLVLALGPLLTAICVYLARSEKPTLAGKAA
ncbi:MAG: MFS transporter [Xenophilus sp.]